MFCKIAEDSYCLMKVLCRLRSACTRTGISCTERTADCRNQSVEQTADMNVRNEQTQPVENHQTDAYNQMPANDYSAPQYQTVNAQGGYNQYQNGQQGGYSYDYNNQRSAQYAQPIPKKKSKTPFIITACGIAVALVVAIAAFFIFNGLNKATPQGQIQVHGLPRRTE